ncbi:MAG: right-handed parallel beta-helix repeat-containing protein [Phycisphaerales bacterium]|nr:MAG: right-handed parallel beta-helix repeat-containing protein [Phycisphaerales bacterium]
MSRHVVVMVLIVTGLGTSAAGDVIYVDRSAPPGGNGRSWDAAFKELYDALGAARPGDELWVAKGSYPPGTQGQGRFATLRLKDDVALYGGFVGVEAEREERDPQTNRTEIAGNFYWSYHVVTASGTGPGAVLDGFVIRRGRANGAGTLSRGGGMLIMAGSPIIANCLFEYNEAEEGAAIYMSEASRPEIRACRFFWNDASNLGGAIMNVGSSPTVLACHFETNHGDRFGRGGGGGGIANWGADSAAIVSDSVFLSNHGSVGGAVLAVAGARPALTRCWFEGNSASLGGAVCLFAGSQALISDCQFERNWGRTVGGGGIALRQESSADLARCVFSNNFGSTGGGGMRIEGGSRAQVIDTFFLNNSASYGSGGGIYARSADSFVVNCLFGDNTAIDGAALDAFFDPLTLINCTVADNEASNRGGGVRLGRDSRVVSSILWGNRDSMGEGEPAQIQGQFGEVHVDYSNVQGWTGNFGGEGNHGLDPRFRSIEDGDYHLAEGSPCIDGADNLSVPEGVEVDLDGAPRFVDNPHSPDVGRGEPPLVDMGAYENQSAGPECTGREKLAARCRQRRRSRVVMAVAKRVEPGARVTFRLDDDPNTDVVVLISPKGKAKVRFADVQPGVHAVRLLECPLRAQAECP